MSLRQERTPEAGVVIDLHPRDLNRMARAPLRNASEIARMQAMAEDVGRQLLEERDAEPGFFPYAPDPIAAELIEAAFKRGMALGRRLERQDAGQIAVSWGPTAATGEHDDPPTTPHSRTGGWIIVAIIVGTAAYFVLRMIQSGGAA